MASVRQLIDTPSVAILTAPDRPDTVRWI
jgi:hypothetical protein